MATCNDCKQDMLTSYGCIPPRDAIVELNGKHYYRLRYSIPSQLVGRVDPDTHRCHDCNAAVNQYHHVGCDMERCPRCGGQFISCNCEEAIRIATNVAQE